MSDPVVFDQIRALTAALPLTVKTVNQVLRVKLQNDPATDGPMFTRWTAQGPGFSEVELRLPQREFGATGSVLSVGLTDPQGQNQKSVMAAFGLDFEPEVPRPQYSADIPVYLRYKFPWGYLTFGVSRDPDKRLVAFTIADESPEAGS